MLPKSQILHAGEKRLLICLNIKAVRDRASFVVRLHHWFAKVPRCRTLVVTVSVTAKSLLNVTN